MDSASLDADVEYILENKIRNLVVNGRGSFENLDVDFLRDVGGIVEHIVLTPPAKTGFDFSGLSACTALLDLKVNVSGNGVVDVSALQNLQGISIDDCSSLIGLDELSNIERAVLSKIPSPEWLDRAVSQKRELRSLSLSDMQTVDGLGCLKPFRIDTLWFFNCAGILLKDLNWLALRDVRFEQCSDVSTFDDLEKAERLETLRIIDSGPIGSVLPFSRMRALHTLIVLGSSYFVDGNLGPLRKKLRAFSFDDRDHYSSLYEEFKDNWLAPIDEK